MTESVDLVERVVRLAWLRRKRALTDAESADIDRLIGSLTQRIEGMASPGERRRRTSLDSIRIPSMQTASGASAPGSVAGSAAADPARGAPSTPAQGSTGTSERPGPAASARSAPVEPALPDPGPPGSLTADLASLPSNAYTPRASMPFLDDYYGSLDGIADSPKEAKRLVDAEGKEVQAQGDNVWLLSADVFGDERTGTQGPSRSGTGSEGTGTGSQTSSLSARSGTRTGTGATGTGTQGTPQAIVHLRSGGNVRGEIRRFKPNTGQVEVHTPRGARTVATDDVLVVFLGNLRKPPPEEGRDVSVILSNDKELLGKTKDYRPDGNGFMLVPTPRRGSVDCVWIPNRSVKRIRAVS